MSAIKALQWVMKLPTARRTLIAKGEAVIVYFDFDAQKSVSIPADIKQFLMNYKVAV